MKKRPKGSLIMIRGKIINVVKKGQRQSSIISYEHGCIAGAAV